MLKNLVKEILDSGLAGEDEIKCCSGEDMVALKVVAGGSLPSAYETFLLQMGRGAGKFMQGTDIFYPGILGLTGD